MPTAVARPRSGLAEGLLDLAIAFPVPEAGVERGARRLDPGRPRFSSKGIVVNPDRQRHASPDAIENDTTIAPLVATMQQGSLLGGLAIIGHDARAEGPAPGAALAEGHRPIGTRRQEVIDIAPVRETAIATSAAMRTDRIKGIVSGS